MRSVMLGLWMSAFSIDVFAMGLVFDAFETEERIVSAEETDVMGPSCVSFVGKWKGRCVIKRENSEPQTKMRKLRVQQRGCVAIKINKKKYLIGSRNNSDFKYLMNGVYGPELPIDGSKRVVNLDWDENLRSIVSKGKVVRSLVNGESETKKFSSRMFLNDEAALIELVKWRKGSMKCKFSKVSG